MSGTAATQAGAGPLAGVRIVELTAFIAAPLATMTLAQMGAEVIRIDPPGGGLDHGRWPLAPSGASLYWAMLNRGKRSVTLDPRTEAGRAAVADLVCKSAALDDGIFLTNLPARGPLAPDALMARRPDCIVVTLDGSPDGASAIDYTVHAACGAAMMSGPAGSDAPLNNAIPFWDLIAGRTLSTALLAALLERARTGRGQLVSLSLSDIAMESVANVGAMAEAELTGRARPRDGNWVYGSFGRDFHTSCGRQFMVAAVTQKQWSALIEATGLAGEVARIEAEQGAPLQSDAARYAARAAIGEALERWSASRTLAEVDAAFRDTAVCWSPYRDVAGMLAEDRRASPENRLFQRLPHPGIEPVLTPSVPFRMSNHPDMPARSAPRLGADTAAILQEKDGKSR